MENKKTTKQGNKNKNKNQTNKTPMSDACDGIEKETSGPEPHMLLHCTTISRQLKMEQHIAVKLDSDTVSLYCRCIMYRRAMHRSFCHWAGSRVYIRPSIALI